MTKTRRNPGRGGKLKAFKQKESHKAYQYLTRDGRERRVKEITDEHNIKREILKHSAEKSVENANNTRGFIKSIFGKKGE